MNNNVEKVDITSGDTSEHLARALKSIRDGYVIVVPLEHGYVYACDAFSHFAVRACTYFVVMHSELSLR